MEGGNTGPARSGGWQNEQRSEQRNEQRSEFP